MKKTALLAMAIMLSAIGIDAHAQGRAANGRYCRLGTPGCYPDWAGSRGRPTTTDYDEPDDGQTMSQSSPQVIVPIPWNIMAVGGIIDGTKRKPDLKFTESNIAPQGNSMKSYEQKSSLPGGRTTVVISGEAY